MARVFVVYDFSNKPVRRVLEPLLEDYPEQLHVPGISGGRQGRLWEDAVRQPLLDADAVLAFVDQPNINVGFEIGYALGLGKWVGLACLTPRLPEWLQRPPLKGLLAATGQSLEKIEALVTGNDWLEAPPQLVRGDHDFLLASRGDTDGQVIHRLQSRQRTDWRTTPAGEGWNLDDAPKLLGGIGRLIWAVTPPADEAEKDGIENTCNAVLAGMHFAASGDDREALLCLRTDDYRGIADLSAWAQTYTGSADFLRLTDLFLAGPTEKVADTDDPEAVHLHVLAEYRRCMERAFVLSETGITGMDAVAAGEAYVELDLERTERFAFRESREAKEVTGHALSLEQLMASEPPRPAGARDDDEGGVGRWVVLGEPGAGKSTSARHLVMKLAERDEGPLPVYVSLPALATGQAHPFHVAAEEVSLAPGSVTTEAVAEALRAEAEKPGAVWLLLDGLDEVAPTDLHRVRREIMKLAAELPTVPMVVLGRPIGYDRLPAPFVHAQIRPLPEKRQRQLLEQWFRSESKAKAVWRRIEALPSLRLLTGNPLLLTLVASLAQEGEHLPVNRRGLYGRAIDGMLERRDGQGQRRFEDPDYAHRILRELALVLQEDAEPAWTEVRLKDALKQAEEAEPEVKDWLDQLDCNRQGFLDRVRNTGLLAPQAGPRTPWRFLHRQFREYLAAEALHARGTDAWRDVIEELEDEQLPRWAETLGLLAGFSAQPLDLLRALRERAAPLACRAVSDVDGLDPEQQLDFLVGTKGWEAEHLLQLAQSWQPSGQLSRNEVRARLLSLVTAERSVEQLAFVHKTLADLGMETTSESFRKDFFTRCDRWPVPPEAVPEFVEIPAGTFWMGSPEIEDGRFEDEGPQHEVSVGPFAMARTTVTNAQYRLLRDGQYEPASWDEVSEQDLARHPAVNVSWWGAYLYCAWIGARLPTEAEWEYACRAGTTTPFALGESVTTSEVNFDGFSDFGDEDDKDIGEGRARTVPVDELGTNGWGLIQMHGNVDEWCEDTYHGSYEGAPDDGSAWVDAGSGARVMRGGGWPDSAWYCRSAARSGWHPGNRYSDVGFRPAARFRD